VTRAIAEADWKVLRRVHPLALDRYCERVLAEIERVTHNKAQSTRAAHVLSISLIGANSGAK
jgi:hypothetical protein